MRLWPYFVLLAAFGPVGSVAVPSSLWGQDYEPYAVEARVWLDRGSEPVLQRGERARIYYRVSESAFVSIFHIDTNGNVRMVFPSSPQENHYARAGRDYRVLFPGSSYWYVRDDPGMGYFFIVASQEPFDFRAFEYSRYAGGWDLSRVGQHVYRDPYLAMDDYVAALVPDWEYVGYGLDFTAYHVERIHEYPRFLCYDCHGYQPYYSWNPYRYSCSSFRVVIYDDPYYYPVTRYRGTRVVYVQPRRGVAHFGFKERANGEPGTPQTVVRRTLPQQQSGVESSGTRRAVPRSGVPSAFSPGETSGRRPGSAPGVDGTATRRSSGTSASPTTSRVSPGSVTPRASLPGSSSRGTAQVRPGATRPTGTTGSSSPPTLERRPGSGSSSSATSGGTTTRTTRPSARVRKPGGGTTSGGSPGVNRGGTRSSVAGSSSRTGGSSRSSTVRSSGVPSRAVPTIRSTSGSSRSRPTVRSSGSSSRTSPTVRSTSGSSRSRATVRSSGGGSKSSPPRTSRGSTKPKVRKPGGGGGGSL